MNPILRRELRVRPRAKWAALWLPAACVPCAAILLFFIANADSPDALTSQAARAFEVLAALQTLAWLVVAPGLTASSVAAERERGLLESLQLSGLSPRAIIGGTLGAAAAFAFLVALAALPVWMLCIFLGQISFGEVARVAMLHGATALLGASAGIAWSAWTRRAAATLRVSLISLALWGVGSALAAVMARNLGAQNALWAATVVACLRIFGATNPVGALFSRSAFSVAAPSLLLMPSPPRFLVGLDDFSSTSPFILSLGFQLLLAPFLLWLAARGVRSNFDEPHPTTKQKPATSTVEFDRTPRDAEPFYDIPFVSRLRFANPVLAREIRGKFRQPRVPRWVVWVQSVLGVLVALFYLQVFTMAIVRPAVRAATWWVVAFVALGVVMTAAPMMGAANFARERERGTWEGVHLSPLSAREIINGKIGSALLAILLFAVPVAPILALCVARAGGVSLGQAVLTILLIASTAYWFSMVGTLASWRAGKTAPVAAAMLLFVAAQSVLPLLASKPGWQWLVAFNPPSAITILAGGEGAFGLKAGNWNGVFAAITASFMFGTLGDWWLRRALRAQGHP